MQERKWIGEGCHARVYDLGDGTVLKESRRADDDGWLVWAGYCLDHQGEPHIPEIYSVDVDWREGTYTAHMKKYEEPKTRRDDIDDWALAFTEDLIPELERRSGRWLYNDADGNWMLDENGQAILTDPICAHSRLEGWKEAVKQEEKRYRKLRKKVKKLKKKLNKGASGLPFLLFP